MNKKCLGCGTILQSIDETQKGYVPKEKYNTAHYCERCFKITNYNFKTVTELPNINKYILEEVNKKAKYVYFMVDILNINSEAIKTYNSIKVPKTFVISKTDIIPKYIKQNNIKTWLQETYQIEDIIFQSTKKKLSTNLLVRRMEESNIKEAYLVGYTNSGKSTLVNELININGIKQHITTSSIPNTTIDFIKLKLPSGIRIIDSPGFTYENTLYEKDDFDLIKRINGRGLLKPLTIQYKKDSSIVIENQFVIKSNTNNSLTFYYNNEINITKDFKNKIKTTKEIKIDIPENSDLVIKTLGFINIKKPCVITTNIKEELLEVRSSMFS